MTHLLLSLLVALLAPRPARDLQAPTARIDFPLPTALTDAPSIRVRGSASDADGVAAVRVNGVPASTADGYATWWALVPLEVGENELVVETLDTLGNLDPAAATTIVRRDGVLIGDAWYVAADPLGRRAYVLDQARYTPSVYAFARVLGVDLRDGSLSVVSSRTVGSGPLNNMNTGLGEMDFDVLGQRLVATNAFPGELIAIDIPSGDRTVIAGPDLGIGPSLYRVGGLELDPLAPRAWVLIAKGFGAGDPGHVLEVDLVTGNRKTISSQGTGSPPWPSMFGQLARMPGGTQVAFAEEDVITAVDVATGVQTIVADGSLALGEPWTYLRALTFDPGGRAWTAAWGQGFVFAFDPASGVYAPALEEPLRATPSYVDLEVDPMSARLLALDRFNGALLALPHDGWDFEVVARSGIGDGYSLGIHKGLGLALDGAGRTYVVDRVRSEVLSIDLDDGERRLVSGPSQGSGVELEHPEDAVFDDSGPSLRLIVLDREVGGLVAIDPASGDRTLVSGSGVGAGPPFVMEHMISLPLLNVDRIGGTAYVLDFAAEWYERRLLAVDLATGDRTLISGGGAGSGPPLTDGNDMVLDPLRQRALVATTNSILAVDLVSGVRSEFSGPSAGAGPVLGYIENLAWDAQADRALALRVSNGILMAVHGATGDRTQLYARELGKGPGFFIGMLQVALLRPAPGAEPLLLYSDTEVFGIGVLDLSLDPSTGRVPGYHAILSR
jgi:hypothetical protein